MSKPKQEKTQPQSEAESRRFLQLLGTLSVRQYSKIGVVRSTNDDLLTFSAFIFSTINSKQKRIVHGLKILHENNDCLEDYCLVDFEELKELLLAIKYLFESAKSIVSLRDYTEFEYRTKDFLRIGFYQDESDRQSAFFQISPTSALVHLEFDKFRIIFDRIKESRDYLIAKGATIEATSDKDQANL